MEDFVTFYDTLGVSPIATNSEIKTAYRKLALEFHPDRAPEGSTKAYLDFTTARFIDVEDAYEVLGHSDKRAEYDLVLANFNRPTPPPYTPPPYTPPPYTPPPYTPPPYTPPPYTQSASAPRKIQSWGNQGLKIATWWDAGIILGTALIIGVSIFIRIEGYFYRALSIKIGTPMFLGGGGDGFQGNEYLSYALGGPFTIVVFYCLLGGWLISRPLVICLRRPKIPIFVNVIFTLLTLLVIFFGEFVLAHNVGTFFIPSVLIYLAYVIRTPPRRKI